ncbi:hypothetical protein [Bradyrhizobium diazoefficiens]|uniref:hypothetical protein n=1 Tax=Bradyrhizobium diazoefficiens TaxID=1355477 RepID=UPI00271548FF|nr:hypothetical protein [Bradyrhizobium diazoefficiens]WLC16288.1 hypothetical protein QIH76_40520 [Bradyrhizobium diazoefficiens]
MGTLLVGALSAVLVTCPLAFAHAHSVPADPAAPSMPAEGYSPNAAEPQVLTAIPGAPPQVESVVNRFKVWRTGTTLPACFLNGGQDLRSFFISTARTWLDRGGLGIDFGAVPTYRNCQGPTDRAIRIAFGYQQSGGGWDKGNWSYVGTDANTAEAGPTINIGYAANASLNQLDPRELRRLVLHELGHAVALEHEHQSPLARCQFDWARVIPYYQSHYGWGEQKTKFNLGKLAPTPGIQATQFDPDSIMNYGFPAWMFVQGAEVCEIKENYEPSQTDLNSYAALYPGRLRAIASAEAPTSAPASPQDAHEQEAAQEQQARVLAMRAARAVAELQKLLPDDGQRRLAAELVGRIAKQQFPNFTIDLQNNSVNVGNVTQKTDGSCSSAIAGVSGNVTITSNCTTTNSTVGTQNNVQGNQINNTGTFNNQGGINSGAPPK